MENDKNTPNRLIHQKSPYLLQHAYNPVDWYPWCEEAFEKAREENKPVFLSIGYSSCHWCHVMERESFEDQGVADLLNRDFVAVKVDKEERPDVDAVYMAVCQAFTGQGGWPTTVLATPECKPFFAGTYFPKDRQQERPGLTDLLKAASAAWKSDPIKLEETGRQVSELLFKETRERGAGQADWKQDGPLLIEKALSYFEKTFDPVFGGFGKAPKFPSPHQLFFLMEFHESQQREAAISEGEASRPAGRPKRPVKTKALEMAEKTLQQMYAGGIYDHIGGGFCRYSTDEKWLVPHFEKMLYDNALLCMAYTEAFRITGKPLYRRVAEEILSYVAKEMRSPQGGFYSAQDADSQGEEGGYYLFSREEVLSVLGQEEGEEFCGYYNITDSGNFEGKNIPNLIETLKRTPDRIWGIEEEAFGGFDDGTAESAEKKKFRKRMDDAREKLYQYRLQRFHLYTDDKILTSWNSLMIAAFARASQVFGKKEYLRIAREAEAFLQNHLIRPDGGLFVRSREGESAGEGFLDDYAFYAWALVELFCAEHRASWLQKAMDIQERIFQEFSDEEKGGFYLTGLTQLRENKADRLLFRPKETWDGALPSGNSAAAWIMVRLYEKLPGSVERRRRIEEQLSYLCSCTGDHPAGSAFGLAALMEWIQWEKVRETN